MNMRIESIHIQNFRTFRDVEINNIGNLCVLVGANGSGKSTFFDVFSFLKDSLSQNVSKALTRRGGFKEVVSKTINANIIIEIKFRETQGRLVTYSLEISPNPVTSGGIIQREILKYRRGQGGKPWHFIDFSKGQGEAIVDIDTVSDIAQASKEQQSLSSPDILAIKALGQLQKFRVASELRNLIENWHVSDFKIDSARPSVEDATAEHLNQHGDNLANVAQYIQQYHPEVHQKILQSMHRHIPGVIDVEATPMLDGRIVLRFRDGAFTDAFVAKHVSDGTIKMFAYLVLLHDPKPFPLLAIEEPENQIYMDLLPELAEEFRAYAERGSQVFVSSHSPDLLNGLNLEDVYWLVKKNGFTQIRKTSDDELLRNMVAAGETLGTLWRQGFMMGAHP